MLMIFMRTLKPRVSRSYHQSVNGRLHFGSNKHIKMCLWSELNAWAAHSPLYKPSREGIARVERVGA